jgi:hypothetical protein
MPLGVSVRVFPERFYEWGRIHPAYVWHQPIVLGGSSINWEKEKIS